MKFLRNPLVVSLLAVGAVVLVLYQTVGDKLLRGRFARSKSATSVTGPVSPAPATLAAEAPAGRLFPPPRAITYTNLEAALLPAEKVEAAFVEARFETWVSAPLRDPFLLLQSAVGEAGRSGSDTNSPVPTWTLSAIWNQTDSRLAVINGKVWSVGDMVAPGYKLIRIEKDEVWFQGPQLNERLRFPDRRKSPARPGAPINPPPTSRTT